MAYYYGSLAVLGWAWMALVGVVALALWIFRAKRRERGFDVIQSDEPKH